MFAPIALISFDLDDTLWPFGPAVARAERVLFDWLHAHVPGCRSFLHTPAVLREFRARVLESQPELAHDMSGLRCASIAAILQAAGASPALVDVVYPIFLAERQRVDLYPDVLPALGWLAERYPLIAITNGNACVHAAGLGHVFQHVFQAQTTGYAKPDPRIFHTAAAQAGIAPAQVLHVGDDLHLDVHGALGAGMQAAWLRRPDLAHLPPATPSPAPCFSDLHALCRALGQHHA
ncbi:MAG: HAD-IA family hydrolase [Rhodocyclales bacterium]|nr:HAD-IA family hydrolase [Rhodocyclales bacterium]